MTPGALTIAGTDPRTDATGPLNMSSREIAELTGKRHDHVMRDIRDMLEALGEDAPRFGAMAPDAYGRKQPIYLLPKDLTLTLIAGYSAPLRHRIVPEQYRNRHSEYIRENADALLPAICGDGSEQSHQDQRGFACERPVASASTIFTGPAAARSATARATGERASKPAPWLPKSKLPGFRQLWPTRTLMGAPTSPRNWSTPTPCGSARPFT